MIRLPVLSLVAPLALAACGTGEQAASVSLVGYNHTDKEIIYSVEGSMSVYLAPHSGGGVVCCATLHQPAPGATVTMEWQQGAARDMLRREVVLPDFDGGVSGFRVHFLRSGEIRVFITHLFPGHPHYPLQGEPAQLYPPGESPGEKWAVAGNGTFAGESGQEKMDVLIAELRRAGATGGLPAETLRSFMAEQIEVAAVYGITDLDDLLDYMILALYTSGRFIEHPHVTARLSQPESRHSVPFREWAKTVPHEELEMFARPLWEAPAE